MQGIADFHKVSFNQFLEDSKQAGFVGEDIDPEIVKIIWDKIKIPDRTNGAAGYKFYWPYPFSVAANRTITVPTGIKADIQPGYFLMIVPCSDLKCKHGMDLTATCGIIDGEYFYSNNEGHIIVEITVKNNMCVNEGDCFMQGIFIPHGVTRQG